MTNTSGTVAEMSLVELMRAKRLPPPARRREIREAANLSRRAIAKELGVSGTTVQWWERDDGTNPRPATALAYIDLLELIEAENADAAQQRLQADAETELPLFNRQHADPAARDALAEYLLDDERIRLISPGSPAEPRK